VWEWLSALLLVAVMADPLWRLHEPFGRFDKLENSLIPLSKFVEGSPTNAMDFLVHAKVRSAVCVLTICWCRR
jgi:hypothetical protein